MKIQSFFTILICLVCTVSTAQDFSFGVKGGLNVASIGGGTLTGVSGLGSKISFHIGGVAEVPISEKLALQPELLYSAQGTNWNFVGSSNLSLDYVNLPILAKYYFLDRLSAEAGPVVGYLINTNDDIEDYKSIDLGIALGASFKLNDHIFFSIRYQKGISDINNVDTITVNNQNNVLQLSAGYAF